MRVPSELCWIAIVMLGGAGACANAPDLAPTSAESVPAEVPDATARYRVTFDATWSAETHPTDFPPTPHFSGLIGATHRDSQRFWDVGAPASEGIRLMAERGRKTPLDQEIEAAIAAGGAQYVLSGTGADSPGRAELEFDISVDHPNVTLVTMVAPSPDWFVGVSALRLLGNDWVTEQTVMLLPYDAGTDSGATFLSPDQATAPRLTIHPITGAPFSVGGTVPPLGTFTFRRIL
jgi:hypothetical protein